MSELFKRAAAFCTGKLARPPSQSAVTFFLVIVMMAMVKPAHASGTVPRTSTLLWCSHESNPASCTYSTKEEACVAMAADNPMYNHNPVVGYSGGWFVGWLCYGQYQGTTNYYSLGWLTQRGACPANSTSLNTSSCTCNGPTAANPINYVPDALLHTSCVPEVACPVDPLPHPPFPASDICSNSLEKGRGKDIDNVCPALNSQMTEPNGGQLQCLADKIRSLALPTPYNGPSATIRTEAYQNHLLAVWDKQKEISNKVTTDADRQACATIIADVTREKDEIHGIDAPPSKKNGKAPHVLGRAVDIPKGIIKAMIAALNNTTVVVPVNCFLETCMSMPVHIGDVQDYVNSPTLNPPACNLRWGGRFKPYDPVHFQLF